MMNNPYEDALIFLLKEHARTADGPGSQQAHQHLEAIESMAAGEAPAPPTETQPQ